MQRSDRSIDRARKKEQRTQEKEEGELGGVEAKPIRRILSGPRNNRSQKRQAAAAEHKVMSNQDKRVGERASEGLQRTGEKVQGGVQKGAQRVMGDQPQKVKEQTKGMMQQMRDKAPLNRKQVLGLITLLTGGTVLFVGGGLAIAGTIITLIIATPILILASPVLIPIGITLFLGTAGLLTAGATVLAFLYAVRWIYRYFTGRQPIRQDELEAARQRLIETASQVQERAREYGSNVSGLLQSGSKEAAPGA